MFLSALFLRGVAVLLMLCDHLALSLSGTLPPLLFYILRGFGRVAFPLFAFLTVNGYHHTHSPRRYALRLLLFALLSEPCFDRFLHRTWWYPKGQNVFFTLLLGLLAIMLYDACQKRHRHGWLLGCLGILAALLGCRLLATDYGIFGVALIVALHFAREKRRWQCLAVALFAMRKAGIFYARYICAALPFFSRFVSSPPKTPVPPLFDLLTLGAAAALLPLLFYKGKKGKTPQSPVARRVLQYGFYLFYPLHLLVLGLLFR